MPAFSDDDLAPLSDEAYDKILNAVATLVVRIDSQCKINEAHDDLHR